MKPNEHANMLSIFAWIYAGIQGFMFLFILLYLVILGLGGVMSAVNGNEADAGGLIVVAVIFVIIGFLALVGLATIIANIRMGRRLRGGKLPTQQSIVITSILNICSFLCGGIIALPFGTALGVYGLWFALSEQGKMFLSGQTYDPVYAYPPNPQLYTPRSTSEPYRWQ
jgi:hypothetical protein